MHIGIVGGGYSGALLAIHIAKLSPSTQISIIDPNGFGKGIAYSTPYDYHLLNVPAGNMSAFEDSQQDFVTWLETNNISNPSAIGEPLEEQFISRRVYGNYLMHLIENAVKDSQNIKLISDEATKLIEDSLQCHIELRSGQSLTCDKAVLAFGNSVPDSVFPFANDISEGSIINNPWDWQKIKDIPKRAQVLIIGTGLTMVDVVLSLSNSNYQGQITALSRHGFIPQAHNLKEEPSIWDKTPETVREFLEIFRQRQSDQSWRGLVDGLRGKTQSIWYNLPIKEQQRFLRHLRVYWDVHRHRIYQPIHSHLTQMMHDKSLKIHSGRVTSIVKETQHLNIQYRPRHKRYLKTIEADIIVNCIGPNSDYTKLKHPLLESLKTQGWLNACPLRLGIKVNKQGALLNQQEQASKKLYSLGPPTKGIFWEIIAIPDIRKQIKELCETLLSP